MKKELGKISSVSFGLGGYQNATLGLHVTLEFGGGGCADTISAWDCSQVKCHEYSEWTEEDRSKQYDDIMRKLSELLHKAKVDTVDQLKGMPIEVTT